jgi:hypothetical protein
LFNILPYRKKMKCFSSQDSIESKYVKHSQRSQSVRGRAYTDKWYNGEDHHR